MDGCRATHPPRRATLHTTAEDDPEAFLERNRSYQRSLGADLPPEGATGARRDLLDVEGRLRTGTIVGGEWQADPSGSRSLLLKTTRYFDREVRRRRPYLEDAWLERAVRRPEFTEVQTNGRIRHWIFVDALGKYLRVVTLPDGETVHTAFPDRGFEPPDGGGRS